MPCLCHPRVHSDVAFFKCSVKARAPESSGQVDADTLCPKPGDHPEQRTSLSAEGVRCRALQKWGEQNKCCRRIVASWSPPMANLHQVLLRKAIRLYRRVSWGRHPHSLLPGYRFSPTPTKRSLGTEKLRAFRKLVPRTCGGPGDMPIGAFMSPCTLALGPLRSSAQAVCDYGVQAGCRQRRVYRIFFITSSRDLRRTGAKPAS